MKSGINIRKVLNKLNELDFNVARDRHAFGELYETILKNLQSAGKSGEFYTPRAITQFLTEMIDPQIGEKVLNPASGTGGFLTGVIEHLHKDNTSIETLKQIQESEICSKVHIETIKQRGYDLDIKNPHVEEEEHEYTSQEIIGLLEKSFAKSQDLLQKLNTETIG